MNIEISGNNDKKVEELTLVFTEKKVTVKVYCEDIVFFESMGHYIAMHMKDGSVHKMRSTVDNLIKKLDNKAFVRVHRGFVVNLMYAHKLDDKKVFLHGMWEEVPLSRTYKTDLTNAFIDFKERKYML